MAMVFLAGSAVAARFPTATLDRNQAGGKQRLASGYLLNAAVEHPTNIGWMTVNGHSRSRS